MPLFGPCGEHSTKGFGEGERSLLRAGGSGGVQIDDPDPAEASCGNAGSRGSASGERQADQRPPPGRRAVCLVSRFTCETVRSFVSE